MTDTSTNLSKIQRERLLDICSRIKNKEAVEVTEIAELEQFIKSMKYGLTFERHEEPVDAMLRTRIPVFKEFKEVIHNPDSTDCNFLLEGDNLHSLKLLEKTHKNAIDIIYIDPPYNTLNDDFAYGDKMLDENDGFIHSKWLSFMKERLELGRKLLSNRGIIFISIDDREFANLKLLCDDIFGKENFITMFIWKKNNDNVRKNVKKILVMNEYILCYQKSFQFEGFFAKKQIPASMSNPDNDPRGAWFSANISNPVENEKSKNVYEVEINGHKVKRRWFEDKEVIESYIAQNKIYLPIKKTGEIGVPRLKKFINDFDDMKIANNFIMDWSTSDGQDDLKDIFSSSPFSYPKPVELIKHLIGMYNKQDVTILDFFAGSGTTGQAVIELNREDNAKHRFILCTNNEISASRTLDYLHNKGYLIDVPTTGKNKTIQNKIDKFFKDNRDIYQKLIVDNHKEYETYGICQSVTYPRLQTVITGTRPDGSKYSDGIKANLKYFQTDMIDKTDDDLDELLYEASFYLAELENMAMIDDVSICIANCDEDIDDIIANATERLKEVFIADDVLLSSQQKDFFMRHNIEVKQIPNYYYKEM